MFDSPLKTPNSGGSQNENAQPLFQSTEDLNFRGSNNALHVPGGFSMLGQETIFSTSSMDGLDLVDHGHQSRPGSSMRSRLYSHDSVTSWATEIRGALHQLVTNHNLSGESGDVFALTSAIVGALESLQMQQSQLEESKAEQKTILSQLSREKNSREEFELRSAELEDELEEVKRNQRDLVEKSRNEKRKLDLELINLRDSVARLEVQKKEAEKEVDGWRDRYTKSMQRYMDDLSRLKAQQSAEKEGNAEKDINMMMRIQGKLSNGNKGPYDLYDTNFVLASQDDEDEDGLTYTSGTLKVSKHRQFASSGHNLNDTRSSDGSRDENPLSVDVFQQQSSVRPELDSRTAEQKHFSREEGTSTPLNNEPLTPIRKESPPPPTIKSSDASKFLSVDPAFAVKSERSGSFDASMGMTVSVPFKSNQLGVMMEDERTVSVQSFETNHEPLYQELKGFSRDRTSSATPSTISFSSSHDILSHGSGSHSRSKKGHASNSASHGESAHFEDRIIADETLDDWNSFDEDIPYFMPKSPASNRRHSTLVDQSEERSHKQEDYLSSSHFVPIQFAGMNEEVQQLLEENSRLQETKNALNVVKDDLIAKVDQLTNEQEFMKEEMESLHKARDDLQERLRQMDAEAKRLNAELERSTKEVERNRQDGGSISLADELSMSLGASNSVDKKFTKREVSTLLMERNMYKERYLELQETVRWMGMMQAERAKNQDLGGGTGFNSTSDQRKISSSTGIWKLFSGIFGSSNQSPGSNGRRGSAVSETALKFDDSGPQVFTAVKANRSKSTVDDPNMERGLTGRRRQTVNTSSNSKASLQQMGAAGNRVINDDGRADINAWSVNASVLPPAAGSSLNSTPPRANSYGRVRSSTATARRNASAVIPEETSVDGGSESRNDVLLKQLSRSVPVPSYSRPLMEKDPTFRNLSLQCACSVVLRGGQYSSSSSSSSLSTGGGGESVVEEWMMGNCSVVWLCSSSATCSRVSLFDLSSPAECLASLTFTHSQILTVHSVPGYVHVVASEASGSVEGVARPEECAGETVETADGGEGHGRHEEASAIFDFGKISNCVSSDQVSSSSDFTATSTLNQEGMTIELNEAEDHLNDIAEDILNSSNSANSQQSSDKSDKLFCLPRCYWPPNVTDEKDLLCSSENPTVWIGCENGNLFVHSSVADWNRSLHSVRLPSSINSINHVANRVFVGLSGGSVAVFYRDPATRHWDLQNYQLLDLGRPAHCVRCSTVAPATPDHSHYNIWLGSRNKIHVIDPVKLKITGTIAAHVRRESQVRHLASCGLGVWVSIRMESTLKLFHAVTHQHLQDVNPEASIIRIIGQSFKINFLRITSLNCIGNSLWIGTNVGVIVTLPVGEDSQTGILSNRSPGNKSGLAKPGGIVRVFNHSDEPLSLPSPQTLLTSSTSSNERSTTSSGSWDIQMTSHDSAGYRSNTITAERKNSALSIQSTSGSMLSRPANDSSSTVPYCQLSQMRLSYHAHRHDVKFFVGATQSTSDSRANGGDILHVMSGGRGYIDHRIGDKVEETEQNVPVVVSSTSAELTASDPNYSLQASSGSSGSRSSKNPPKSQRSHIIMWKLEPTSHDN